MRAQITPEADGGHYLAMFGGGACMASVPALEGHDIDDLIAALAEVKAMTRTCAALSGGGLGNHTCRLPPGHAGTRQCRACPEQWR